VGPEKEGLVMRSAKEALKQVVGAVIYAMDDGESVLKEVYEMADCPCDPPQPEDYSMAEVEAAKDAVRKALRGLL